MIKSTGIGIGPKLIQTQEAERPPENNQTPQAPSESLTQIKAANTSIAAEYQISTLAIKNQLQNQLDANSNQWNVNSNPKWTKPFEKSEASNWGYLPKTLATGDGDDKVDIKMGSDGRVHVNVNGKEEWSGTPKQFAALTIDTGGGKDVVRNEVDGANIVTGLGNDEVWNKANNTNINTGAGDDVLGSEGSHNILNSEAGADSVRVVGNDNTISTGTGSDYLGFKGDSNRVNTGRGSDEVDGYGQGNTIQTESGDDKVRMKYGDYIPENPISNFIDTGAGNDFVENRTDGATIKTDSGNDVIANLSSGTSIETGEGRDQVESHGTDVTVDGESGINYLYED